MKCKAYFATQTEFWASAIRADMDSLKLYTFSRLNWLLYTTMSPECVPSDWQRRTNEFAGWMLTALFINTSRVESQQGFQWCNIVYTNLQWHHLLEEKVIANRFVGTPQLCNWVSLAFNEMTSWQYTKTMVIFRLLNSIKPIWLPRNFWHDLQTSQVFHVIIPASHTYVDKM